MKKAAVWISVLAAAAAAAVTVCALALCIMFPNKYADELGAAADEFGLDRTLVKSVVWAESGFDRNAVSAKGAVGLMQLMPQTFDECASKLSIEISERSMRNPVNSLRCGCYYLSLLTDRFDGNVTAALMAYNAGERNAERFLNGEKVFDETRRYLNNVERAKRVYGLFA